MDDMVSSFSSFSVDNLDAARTFYADVLGLEVDDDTEMHILHLLDNSVMIYPKPNHEAAEFTVLNFVVEDIEAAVEKMAAAGVEFEQYDSEYIKTDENGIADQGGHMMAWFKDPAGNTLSILSES